uniref:Uncharacterized protein n=1 Tax=Anopheles christyi TaxID=43041 RepID=A0A182JU00_9DIPT
MYRLLAFIGALSLCFAYALATDCPHCIGPVACGVNQTVPKVTCTPAIVNQTVTLLKEFYKNTTEFTASSKVYSCVKVNFRNSASQVDTFAVQGCTAGSKSICRQPTFDFNGSLNCSSQTSSTSQNNNAQKPFVSVLLSVAFVVGAFAMAS